MRPLCNRCKHQLTGKVVENVTTCPNCGKRWMLVPDETAIVGTTLEIHDVTHKSAVPKIGEKDGKANP